MKIISLVAMTVACNCGAASSDGALDRGLLSIKVKLANGSGAVAAGMAVATDAENNYYSSGSFAGSAPFGTNLLTSSAPCDAFLAKYDREKRCLWARQISHASASSVATVAGLDAVFIAGTIKGDTTLGQTPIKCRGKADIYLAKFDGQGNLLWFKQAGGPDEDRGDAVAVDSVGNSYLTGQFRGPAAFDGITLQPQGPCDFFIAKYDPEGKLLWVKRDGGGFTEARGIAVDVAGNAVVTGVFFKSAWFGEERLTESGGGDLFVVKYGPAGNCLWARNPGGPWSERVGHNVAMDSLGNPHVVGLIQGTLAFGATNVVLLDDKRHANVFLAKYSAAGEFQWVRQFRKGDFDFSNVVNVEASGIKVAARRSVITEPTTVDTLSSEEMALAIRASTDGNEQAVPGPGDVGPQAPVLGFRKFGAFVILFWPKEYASFVLEASDTLAPFPVWETVAVRGTAVGEQVAVAIAVDRAVRFYRLRKP